MSIYKERPVGNCDLYLFTLSDGPYVGYCHGDDPNYRWRNGNNYAKNPELTQAIKDAGGFDKVPKYILIKGVSDDLGIDIFEPYLIKILNSQYPNGYNKDSGGRRGYNRCQATKEKISAALSKPVDQIDTRYGVAEYTWSSSEEASLATKINRGNISSAKNGNRPTAGGWAWQSSIYRDGGK